MRVTLADTISGAIGREGDIDFFAIDLTAGTQLDANVDIGGSALYNPTFALIAADGVTPLVEHNWESQEYRLRYTIQTTGRYYLRVANYRPGTGTYVLRVGRYVVPAFGPGDPVAALWSGGNESVSKIAAGPTGDLFVGNIGGVFRVTAGRDSVPVALGIDAEFGLAVDSHGDLLTLGCEYPNGAIWRISPSGARSRFFLGEGTPYAVTIGPDGDVWINDSDAGAFWRFDAAGHRKASLGVNWFAGHMAFSPGGHLYFTDAAGLHRIVNDVPELVIPSPSPMQWFDDFVFDREGYIYMTLVIPREGGADQRVLLFDPRYHLVQDPFAQVGDHFVDSRFTDLAFARDADGSMSARLVVGRMVVPSAQRFTSDIVELNPEGIRAPGWLIGAPQIDVQAVVSAALGVRGILSPEQEQLLDAQGNHNGALDIGDLRAYLRSHQQ
jgi:streptogramin lyase